MTNMKKANEARIGDTFKLINTQVVAEEGFEPAKPLVYCGIYPIEPETYSSLTTSLSKLSLTDPAVTIVKESSAALGNGFRCGFLGLLHMDVFRQRLEDEYS
jgi:translation elongation factor EF-4